jgi:hypothetical protein
MFTVKDSLLKGEELRIRRQIRIRMDPFSVELLDPNWYHGAELNFS